MAIFLQTKSQGVRRLSLVLGVLAGGFHVVTKNEPYGPPSQIPDAPWQNLSINLLNLFIEFALYFIAAWVAVRVVAWVIDGFIADRN